MTSGNLFQSGRRTAGCHAHSFVWVWLTSPTAQHADAKPSVWHPARAFLAAALVLAWPGRVAAQADVDAQLRQIRETWYALDESAKPFRTKYTERLYRAEAVSPLELDTEHYYTSVYAPVGRSFENRTYYHEKGKRKFEGELYLTNDQYKCKLVDKADDGHFILAGQPTMLERKWTDGWTREQRLRAQFPWLQPAHTYFVPDLLDLKLCQISKIEDLGSGLVRIAFRARTDLAADDKKKLFGVTAGTLVLNRDKHYRLESAENQRAEESFAAKQRFTYEEVQSVDSLLKGMETESKWIRKSDQTPMAGKMVWEFECRYDIEVDPRQFYMSYYGLPEPLGVTAPKKPTPRYLWFLAAAAVLAALSLLFRWLMKRRSRTASPIPTPMA